MFYAHEYVKKGIIIIHMNARNVIIGMQSLVINFTFVVYWHDVTNK